jgi:lipid II:glycine glycyltransferase (peptidoglycan interpeptide bridge formation enzyme)
MIGRKKFRSSVDIDVFAEVQRNLPEAQKMRIFLCECRGTTVAAAIGTCIGDTGIYLFGATSDDGKELKGSYLLQWRMIAWMKERGCRRYDLGGIDPEGNPGVYHFKKGISNEEVRHIPRHEANGKRLSAWALRRGEQCRNLLQWVRTADFRRSR